MTRRYIDLNDEHVFKQFKLSELITESKTVVYYPDYLLQVPPSPWLPRERHALALPTARANRPCQPPPLAPLLQVQSQQQLINLLDYAVYIRNISMCALDWSCCCSGSLFPVGVASSTMSSWSSYWSWIAEYS